LNRAGDRGGAIRLGISQAEITNSTFEENYAAYLGGGIHAWNGSTVQISSNNFHNNFALDGAAIFVVDDGSSGTVSENSFCGNHVNDLSGNWTDGGGNTITDECPPDCPDINGDGYVNVTDILAVIADWGSTDSPADVIQDGIVDVSDVLLVISNWGPCE
jgi:predicted outer membrane repeat protein